MLITAALWFFAAFTARPWLIFNPVPVPRSERRKYNELIVLRVEVGSVLIFEIEGGAIVVRS
ncbi:hypothetical protein A1354_00325 [Pseudomonas asplenii]|nr:hypothetical protein A1354_00325 [Pseudomonas asplenii]